MRKTPSDQNIRVLGDVLVVPAFHEKWGRHVVLCDNSPDVAAILKEFSVGLQKGRHTLYAHQIGRVQHGQTCLLHRLIMEAPQGKEVDHKNGDGLDNRRANLRVVDRWENMQNCRVQVNSKSKVRGLHQISSGKWRAQVVLRGEVIHLGYFHDENDAVDAINAHRMRVGIHETATPPFAAGIDS